MEDWWMTLPVEVRKALVQITNRIPLITDDGKFEFYKKQGLELIVNKK